MSEKLCGLPRKDLCLADFYAWQFGQVKEIARRRLLCFLAERELDRRMRRQPQRLHEDPNERAKRILAMYEGVSALEAAVFEDCSEAWIRKLRRENDHDQTLGGQVAA